MYSVHVFLLMQYVLFDKNSLRNDAFLSSFSTGFVDVPDAVIARGFLHELFCVVGVVEVVEVVGVVGVVEVVGVVGVVGVVDVVDVIGIKFDDHLDCDVVGILARTVASCDDPVSFLFILCKES